MHTAASRRKVISTQTTFSETEALFRVALIQQVHCKVMSLFPLNPHVLGHSHRAEIFPQAVKTDLLIYYVKLTSFINC